MLGPTCSAMAAPLTRWSVYAGLGCWNSACMCPYRVDRTDAPCFRVERNTSRRRWIPEACTKWHNCLLLKGSRPLKAADVAHFVACESCRCHLWPLNLAADLSTQHNNACTALAVMQERTAILAQLTPGRPSHVHKGWWNPGTTPLPPSWVMRGHLPAWMCCLPAS